MKKPHLLAWLVNILLGIILVWPTAVQPNPSIYRRSHLAPKSSLSDKMRAHMDLVLALRDFQQEFGGKKWKKPSRDIFERILHAARRYWENPELLMFVDLEGRALVFKSGHRSMILAPWPTQFKKDRDVLGTRMVRLSESPEEKIDSYYLRVYATGSTSSLRRDFYRLGAAVSQASGAGKFSWPWLKSLWEKYKRAGLVADANMIYGYPWHVASSEAERQIQLVQEILHNIPRKHDGSGNAIFIMENVPAKENVLKIFREQFSHHASLGDEEILMNTQYHGDLKKAYAVCIPQEQARISKRIADTTSDPRKAISLGEVVVAMVQSQKISVRVEPCSFERWIASIPVDLSPDSAFRHSDFDAYIGHFGRVADAMVKGSTIGDRELSQMFEALHREDPHRVIIAMRETQHEGLSYLFKDKAYSFKSHRMVSPEEMEAAGKMFAQWKSAQSASAHEKKALLVPLVTQVLMEQFLRAKMGQRADAIRMAQQVMPILQRKVADLETWFRGHFSASQGEGNVIMRIMSDLVGMRIIGFDLKDPNNPIVLVDGASGSNRIPPSWKMPDGASIQESFAIEFLSTHVPSLQALWSNKELCDAFADFTGSPLLDAIRAGPIAKDPQCWEGLRMLFSRPEEQFQKWTGLSKVQFKVFLWSYYAKDQLHFNKGPSELILALLNSDEASVRRMAIDALVRFSSEGAVTVLAHAAVRDADPSVLEAAQAGLDRVLSLQRLSKEKSQYILTGLLADSNPAVRVEAVRRLQGYVHEGTMNTLLTLVHEDPDDKVKAIALKAVDALIQKPELSLPMLSAANRRNLKELSSLLSAVPQEWEVLLAHILGSVGDGDTLHVLQEAFRQKPEQLAFQQAIDQITSRIAMAEKLDQEIARLSAMDIGQIQDTEVPELLDLASQTDPEMISGALRERLATLTNRIALSSDEPRVQVQWAEPLADLRFLQSMPEEVPLYSFYDSLRFRRMTRALEARGVSQRTIANLIGLLTSLKGPARYYKGDVFATAYLIRLEKEIARITGEPEKNLVQMVREYLYHELVHSYLASPTGWRLVKRKVLNHPLFNAIHQEMQIGFPVSAPLHREYYAAEAAAKLLSLLFEGDNSSSVMRPSLRSKLMALKADLENEPEFKDMTAGGILAQGDPKKQKAIFQAVKIRLGRFGKRVSVRIPTERTRSIRGRMEHILSDSTSEMETFFTSLAASKDSMTVEQCVELLRRQGLRVRHGLIHGFAKRIATDSAWLEKLEYVYNKHKGDLRDVDLNATDYYARLLLHFSPQDDFQALVLVWEPDHHTRVLNYGQDAWGVPNGGAVRVLSADPSVEINNYEVGNWDKAQGTALLQRGPTLHAKPGQVVGVPTVHEVRNNTQGRVYSLHLTSSPITEAYTFLPADAREKEFSEDRAMLAKAQKVPDIATIPITFAEIEEAPTKAELAASVYIEIAAFIEKKDIASALQALADAVRLGLLPKDVDRCLSQIRHTGLLMESPLLHAIVPVAQKAHRMAHGEGPIDTSVWRYSPFRDKYSLKSHRLGEQVIERLADGTFGIKGSRLHVEDEEILLRKLLESVSFYDFDSEKRKDRKLHLEPSLGIVVQEVDKFAFDLAKSRLGDIAARTALLDNVYLYIKGERKETPHVMVQEPLTSIKQRWEYLVGQKKDLVEAKKLVDSFIDLQHALWDRKVVDPGLDLKGVGLTRNGQMRITRLENLKDSLDGITQQDWMAAHQGNQEFLAQIDPELAVYYATQVQDKMSLAQLNAHWNAGGTVPVALEMPPVLEWIASNKQKDQLADARMEVVIASLRKEGHTTYCRQVEKIVAQYLNGHPVSHYLSLGLVTFDKRHHYFVHMVLQKIQAQYQMRRYEDKFLSRASLWKIAQKILAYRDRGGSIDQEIKDLIFAFETFILKPCRQWSPAARAFDWEGLKAQPGVLDLAA